MAPPPGKRRSCMTYVDGPLDTLVEPSETVDADPSDALTSQIASSILRERYGVDSAEAVPLKVQEAVRTCLRDVSSTVEHEHPQWGLPTYRSSKGFRSSMNGSEATPRAHARNSNSDARRSRKRGPSQRGDDDDDPFPYDERNNKDGSGNQRGGLRDPTLKKKAKLQSNLQGYPCPYRRRNPVFFNIREHEHCARRNFTDITELKSVLRSYSSILYQCANLSIDDMYEHTTGNKGRLTSALAAGRDLRVKRPCPTISQSHSRRCVSLRNLHRVPPLTKALPKRWTVSWRTEPPRTKFRLGRRYGDFSLGQIPWFWSQVSLEL